MLLSTKCNLLHFFRIITPIPNSVGFPCLLIVKDVNHPLFGKNNGGLNGGEIMLKVNKTKKILIYGFLVRKKFFVSRSFKFRGLYYQRV